MEWNASETATCLLDEPPGNPLEPPQEPLQESPETPAADSSESAGFSPKNGPHVQGPLSAAWISEDLLQRTRDVWSELAGREISADEAVEILINVKNLTEFLLDMKDNEMKDNEMKEEVTT